MQEITGKNTVRPELVEGHPILVRQAHHERVTDAIIHRLRSLKGSLMELTDSHGRTINYLRLSVTDRCNFRCRYCMPVEGVQRHRQDDILSYEDLIRVAEAAISIGVEKIRITGGEPLVRKGIVPFISSLASLPGLRHLALTTNGYLLDTLAGDLKKTGLQRLNISLDSLDSRVFAEITRGGSLERVMAGIGAAALAGFPIKLNVVAMRGINDQELFDFAELTHDHPYTVRFIEYMPNAGGEGWRDHLLPGAEILERLSSRYQLEPLDRGPYSGPSRDFRIVGAHGSLGIITPISGHFCGQCNRIRVTSTGFAKSCLFSDAGVDLKSALRDGSIKDIAAALLTVVNDKPQNHHLSGVKPEGYSPFAMSGVGG